MITNRDDDENFNCEKRLRETSTDDVIDLGDDAGYDDEDDKDDGIDFSDSEKFCEVFIVMDGGLSRRTPGFILIIEIPPSSIMTKVFLNNLNTKNKSHGKF